MNVFRLSLGYNRIRTVDPAAFSSLDSSLKYLNLENNQLMRIPWEAIQNLSALIHLYVGSNLIQDEGLSMPLLDGNPNTTSINLTCNL